MTLPAYRGFIAGCFNAQYTHELFYLASIPRSVGPMTGGIGYLAVVYGYQRFDNHIMIATIVALIATIQLIQFLGDRLVNRLRHTQGNLV